MPRRNASRLAYIAGTCDTKHAEILFVRNQLWANGVDTCVVDLGIRSTAAEVDVTPRQVAAFAPQGEAILELTDRGAAVTAMAEAFAHFLASRDDVAGIISLGGSGNTSLVAPAMQALPIGVPKLMVSTLAAGNVAPYVGESDICMLYPVTDIAGLNRISTLVLANAASALAGMVRNHGRSDHQLLAKPALGMTMFGVTTPCVTAIREALEQTYDCLVFHATGPGGRALEKLVESGLVAGVLDITTTEIADLLCGGVCAAAPGRLDAIARTRVPYVGSVGALDMVNFGPLATVPERYRGRQLHAHNANVTLMRTTPDENAAFGRWIGEKLNACSGPVRFLLPEGGVSMLDAPGQPFHDPAADAALFAALEETVRQTEDRRVIWLPYHLNDPAFAVEAVRQFRAIAGSVRQPDRLAAACGAG